MQRGSYPRKTRDAGASALRDKERAVSRNETNNGLGLQDFC